MLLLSSGSACANPRHDSAASSSSVRRYATLRVTASHTLKLLPQPGTRYAAKVVKIMDYGAFVELTGGTQGLVHISEIAAEKVQSLSHRPYHGRDCAAPYPHSSFTLI